MTQKNISWEIINKIIPNLIERWTFTSQCVFLEMFFLVQYLAMVREASGNKCVPFFLEKISDFK